MRRRLRVILSALLIFITACSDDVPSVSADTTAATIGPATRIITLAPHLTELVYSAGAGNRLVGVVEYSDFPFAALKLPRIGDAFRVDYEAIAELDSDLILAWGSGTPREVVERLEQLGHRVVTLEAESLDRIADNLREIGRLAGTMQHAEVMATAFDSTLDEIRTTAAGRKTVTVFYQVSAQPLFTISHRHVIGEAIELCGGRNVFGELVELSPSVSPEAVIDAAPDVIIAGQFTDEDSMQNSLTVWWQWTSIPAVRDGNLFFVDANLLHRPSVRILDGVYELCARIATARGEGV